MQHSQHHIDGFLTDYECISVLEAVHDVIALGSLFQDYTGEGVTPNEWGNLQLKTVEEVGLSDHKMVRYLPNDRWTSVISEAEWVDLKAHILKKLAPITLNGGGGKMMKVAYTTEVEGNSGSWIVKVFRNGLHHGDVTHGTTLEVFGEEPGIFPNERDAKKASELYLKLMTVAMG